MCPVVNFAARPESRQVLAKRQIGPQPAAPHTYSVAKTGQACLPTKEDDMEHRKQTPVTRISDDGLQNPGTCRDEYPEQGSTSG
ncbi:hypothetical protein MHUMG1_00184 [Metarhizium humberi]|uniref:Uncharacterized protein n=1 Tax=Metarhizium humberi TaxID=2596975 RepID=A0A9P8MJ64_9HYPO|nr:hypothetical protein MHUMG1_00184 [Metarhizium humberi]